MTPAYVGIDVAFSKTKRLPISVCIKKDGKLSPLPLRNEKDLLPPKGKGNRLALNEDVVESFSDEVLHYLQEVERRHNVNIERIAIDAPRSYKKAGQRRRLCEVAMDEMGISCFATPSKDEFKLIRAKVEKHLSQGGAENNIPHANQLWMLVGFSLFRKLSKVYECIEVYPQAIVNALGCSASHKTAEEGYMLQLQSIAKETGWVPDALLPELNRMGFGASHDKLDAFMSAWVASLPDNSRKACGEPPDDVIWVPRPMIKDYFYGQFQDHLKLLHYQRMNVSAMVFFGGRDGKDLGIDIQRVPEKDRPHFILCLLMVVLTDQCLHQYFKSDYKTWRKITNYPKFGWSGFGAHNENPLKILLAAEGSRSVNIHDVLVLMPEFVRFLVEETCDFFKQKLPDVVARKYFDLMLHDKDFGDVRGRLIPSFVNELRKIFSQ